jgi:hypothetical protein
MIQDETAGMTPAQNSEYLRKNMAAMFAGMGPSLSQIVSLSKQGKKNPAGRRTDDCEYLPKIGYIVLLLIKNQQIPDTI